MRQDILFRKNDRYFLANHGAILSPKTDPRIAESKAALTTLVHWIRDFLCEPHRELGRGGNVCPYTAPALKRYTLWFTAITEENPSEETILEALQIYRDWFLELEPTDVNRAIFKSIIIAFPTINAEKAPEYIDAVQAALKSDFVRNGLMIGQFHEGCPEPGLHNADFRPLQSPIPLLAIRNMVRTDIPFLAHDEELMEAYSKLFIGDIIQ